MAALAADSRPGPTWAKDIAPIVYRSCVSCHRPNDIAPMSFLTYAEARPWAKAIRASTVTRRMPPWHADPKVGHFENDPRLTEGEIAAIRAWADNGAPEGDPSLAPPPPKFAEGWGLGQPDLIFDIGQDYKIEPDGPDENTNFTVEMNLKEDIWVSGVDLQPGNRKVVHHAHVKVISPEKPRPASQPVIAPELDLRKLLIREGTESYMKMDAPVIDDGCAHPGGGDYPGVDREADAVLASFLPGRGPDRWPAGYAKRIPAGSKLQFQVHYSRTSKSVEFDRTRVGLVLAKEPPRFEVKRRDIHNHYFSIPAGADSHRVTACYTIPADSMLLSYTPHMHYRGKSQTVEITRPGMDPEVILSVPNYEFEWQTQFKFLKAVPLPAGTKMKIIAHFDNSENKRGNPDATKTVRWGTPSKAEMMDGWIEYITPGSRVSEQK
jgi:hypothetical protein